MHPKVSVILPAYNAERFIHTAIKSILDQTFTDFELLVIDDGSADATAGIVKSFADQRIKYIANEKNSGLAYTLNKGIDLSQGEYIGRMDADDISFTERFQKQVDYLDLHPETGMIDCIMEYIDEKGNSLNKINSNVISYEEIVKTLPWKNCLGHSSVMIRRNILAKYHYKNVGNEDYDLWLRLISDGYIIQKLNETLLFYRIHDTSYTKSAMLSGLQFFRSAHTKRKYLAEQLFTKRKISRFNVSVFLSMLADYITAYYKLFKIKLSKLFLL